MPKLTFQVIRRTIATLGKSKGHPKDIQGLMRHTRLATTMEVYMQSLEKEVRSAINSIHNELMATGTDDHPPQQPEAKADPIHNPPQDLRVEPQIEPSSHKEAQNKLEGEKKPSAPSRGKIIPFAGKMRANGLEGGGLNA